jgi:YbbR domain-containing protein
MSGRISRIWTQLRKEKWLLLLCFVLAFFAWQAIQRNISFELPVANIAVEVEVPEGWAVLDRSLDAVDVRFLGSREDIRDLNREQLRISIPVSSPERGRTMVIPLVDRFLKNNPTGARVVRFNPSEIEIRLDRETEKPLPVKAAPTGSLPEGLEIESMTCKPASVLVRGAQQQLEMMENIHTEPIELKNRQASFKENVRIALPQGGRLQAEPDRVAVEFVLVARISSAVFEKVPVRVLTNPGERRRIDIQPVFINVTVKGQQQRLDQLRSAELFAYVSCVELAENTGYDLPVIVDLPAGLQLVKTEPAAVHIEIGTAN